MEEKPEWIGIIVARNGKDGTTLSTTLVDDYTTPQQAMNECDSYVESTDFCYDNGLADEDGYLEGAYVGAVWDFVSNIERPEWLWKVGLHLTANAVHGYAVGTPEDNTEPRLARMGYVDQGIIDALASLDTETGRFRWPQQN